ncbi:DUF4349 domain-containing protein [Pseudoxanthomonas sp. LH2527]|uniref:DUF4349 domain-containing protein n=1 Tax=Pseudoxanthomonas sp. LH2527 TaxID=2923249 RepID=UPI001F1399AA|nr:DUF4349 domain-containing protein [Pseudoxanthomonas sp. LH2527]MCH6484493.1 DUF4349 domain-containing protein [Pseudoxanthomonas sp. LH2527]
MRINRTYRVASSLALLFLIASCSKREMSSHEAEVAAAAAPAMGEAADAAAAAAPAERQEASALQAPGVTAAQLASDVVVQTDPQRRFIRTAQADFQVKDVYRTALAIEDEVAKQGGFVVDNDIQSQVQRVQSRPLGNGKRLELAEYRLQGALTVRVPSERTQVFLRAIASQMEFLDRRHFTARDAQFDLLRQQLARQRAQDEQQELGDAVQGGGKLGDKADAIHARGEARTSRDEAVIAQKEFEDRVAYSTITLSLSQDVQVRRSERVDVDAVFRDNGPGFFRQLGDALAVGWRGGQQAVVALAALWPLWLVVLAMVIGWRRWRRKPAAG